MTMGGRGWPRAAMGVAALTDPSSPRLSPSSTPAPRSCWLWTSTASAGCTTKAASTWSAPRRVGSPWPAPRSTSPAGTASSRTPSSCASCRSSVRTPQPPLWGPPNPGPPPAAPSLWWWWWWWILPWSLHGSILFPTPWEAAVGPIWGGAGPVGSMWGWGGGVGVGREPHVPAGDGLSAIPSSHPGGQRGAGAGGEAKVRAEGGAHVWGGETPPAKYHTLPQIPLLLGRLPPPHADRRPQKESRDHLRVLPGGPVGGFFWGGGG